MNPRASGLATVAILFLVLSLFLVALRCYVRAHLIKGFGADDTTILITMNWWICELFYVASTAILKISIGIFLLRITVRKTHIYVVWATMALSIATGLVLFLFIIFQCSPPSSFWSVTGARGTDCLNPDLVTNMTYAHAAMICIIDCTFGAIPVILVWNLQMDLASKVSLGFILCLGAIGCIASFVRLKSIEQIGWSPDFLYNTVDLAIWSTVEPGVGITAASLATLRPLFRSVFSSTKSDTAPHSHSRAVSLGRLRGDYIRTGEESEAPSPPKRIYMSTMIETTVRPWDGEIGAGSSCEGSFTGEGERDGKRGEA